MPDPPPLTYLISQCARQPSPCRFLVVNSQHSINRRAGHLATSAKGLQALQHGPLRRPVPQAPEIAEEHALEAPAARAAARRQLRQGCQLRACNWRSSVLNMNRERESSTNVDVMAMHAREHAAAQEGSSKACIAGAATVNLACRPCEPMSSMMQAQQVGQQSEARERSPAAV